MHSAAILAGGRARRFGGRDKGALIVEGQTIRDRQIAALSAVAGEILIVGGDRVEGGAGPFEARPELVEGRAQGALQARDHPRWIADVVAGCGPMGGVHAALTAARGDAVIVVACDMPYLTAPFAGYLLDLAAASDFVVPRTERGYHPVCAVYTRACLDPLAKRLAARSLKMTALLDGVRVRVVEAEEIEKFGDRHRLLANVNTPADYAGLEALQGHKR